LKSGKPEDIYLAGRYFLDNSSKKVDVREKNNTLKTAEKLFQKGLTFDTLHGAIARRLTELYIQKNQFIKGDINKDIDKCYKIMTESNSRDDLVNAFTFYATVTYQNELDSIEISYGYVEKIISLSNKLLEMFPNDKTIRNNVARRCSDLSFSLFDFKQEYKNSLIAVEIAIKADSTFQLSYTNLPLAYLFNNMYDEAVKVYLKWKDLPLQIQGLRTYKEAFISDFDDLTRRGKGHPDFAKIRELLNK
jgi:tetratricopeptide (TPR) repeat protein